MEKEITLRIYRGEIIDFPPMNRGPKAQRWCAVISRDYRTPESLHREMLPYNRDRLFPRFDPSSLKLHDALEFGVSWERPGPNPYRRDRRFFVITEIAPDHLVLQPCDTALAAIELSDDLDLARRRQLKQQLAALQAELDSLEDPAF